MKHVSRYNRVKQELEGTSSPQTTHCGRPRTVHPTLAMEQTLAVSAVAEHAAHCRASLQTRVVWKQSRLCGRRMKEAFFIQNNQHINRNSGAEPGIPSMPYFGSCLLFFSFPSANRVSLAIRP
ncbi:hypothetical protein M513_13509 [Trichuris suis]|uniref:Uncharacterized protein n=1 Tax=Trichuris suis TaxID=68888 RepID=A0A085LKX1_9BILA|nr:hypothetical protein M513_13509 [Trichuris suis]